MTPKEIALAIAKALDNKKGIDIKVLETAELTTLADYFVICAATSTTPAPTPAAATSTAPAASLRCSAR